MTPLDLAVRNATYRLFAELGRAPTAAEVGDAAGLAGAAGEGTAVVIASWRRLHDAHALVLLDPATPTPSLRMVNPFSAVETPHRVEAAGRTWFANCGWDAFGVAVVLRSDAVIHTTCPDCDEALDLEVRGYRPTDTDPVFHVLVPARKWWSDIGFT